MAAKKAAHTSPRVRIEVTQDLIDQSARQDSSHCMIANAIKRSVPGARYVSVDLQSIRWTDPKAGKRYNYLTPRAGQLALLDFDSGRDDIQQFSFQLRDAHVVRVRPGKRATEVVDIPTKTKLVDRGKDKVPARLGGQSPPIGPLSNTNYRRGRKRAFGLRAMGR